jgi:uncharacterized protein
MVDSGIQVTGTGEVTGIPDTVTFQLGVSVTRKTVAEASRDAGRLAGALIESLAAHRVGERDVQTSNLSLNPSWEYPPNRQPKLTGYTFANTVLVTVRDVDSAGAIIDAALSAAGDGAVLNGVHFSLDDDAEANVAARASAFADARSKAEQLAALARVTLGPAVAIEELDADDAPAPLRSVLRAAAEAGPPVAAGEVTTRVRVAVRFAVA